MPWAFSRVKKVELTIITINTQVAIENEMLAKISRKNLRSTKASSAVSSEVLGIQCYGINEHQDVYH
jgi:hypothetical protein